MNDRAWARRMAALIRRPAFIATVTVVVLAVVVGGLAWSAGRNDGAADASHSPGIAGASASPGSASSSDDPWASLQPTASLQPLPDDAATPTAALTASAATGSVVPVDVSFRLASTDGTPASVLASRLTVDPPLTLAVDPEPGDQAARLTPSEALAPGAAYRFALHGSSGELLDTWAFQTSAPLRVVGTLPEGESSDVPLDTGIEIVFDQDGTLDAASHVSIAPATPGRFEQHERTFVIIPDKPLIPATIYTVTVTAGVSVSATGEATQQDTRFRFETAGTATSSATVSFEFQDPLFESATASRPVVAVGSYAEAEDAPAPTTTRLEVFKLAHLPAGIDAYRTIRARPTWARWSDEGLVETSMLRRVVNAELHLEPYRGAFFARLPKALPAGWYLVQDSDGTRPVQAVLQVTDVAGYLAISQTNTLVWANDLANGRPIVGATVASEGTAIDRTDAHGLAMGPTPGGLLPKPSQDCAAPCEPVVTIRTSDGRAVFLPTSLSHDKNESYGGSYTWSDTNTSYWNLLHTDRNHYRAGDAVNLWGFIRSRTDSTVPATIAIRAMPMTNEEGVVRPSAATITLTPGATGTFTGSMALAGLAEGYYELELVVDGTVIRSTSIQVGPIAKPAYRLDITTGRRVYIAGDRIKVSVGAAFFEGTPVPGVPVRISAYMVDEVSHVATTDVTGTGVFRTMAKAEPDAEGAQETIFEAAPARAEEGEITGASREIVIFPSSRTIAATTRISGGRVRISGDVHWVDVARLEAAIAAGRSMWELDPRGAAVGGATVTIRFIELVPIHTQIGTEYDFIEKKVVPVYEDRIIERPAGSIKVKTTAKGGFAGSVAATTKDHDYKVVASVGDPDGHRARTTVYANRHPWASEEGSSPTLTPTGPTPDETGLYGVGDRIEVTMGDPDTAQSAGDGTSYLFFEAHGGLREATIQSSPRYVSTFTASAVPDLQIDAVRFTGSGYVGTVGFFAGFRLGDRRLQVDLTTDTSRYRPGGRVTIAIRTRDAAGSPIAATVVLRAVDEKLFIIGAASEDDPLAELYASLGSGLLGTYETHRPPSGDTGGGDTTGGGGDQRDDFRDSLLFKSVTTDAKGRASMSFDLSDDVTSWRVSASGVSARLDAGYGSVLVPVSLPFFVDASVAPEYLLADRPSIPVRAYGTALGTDDLVKIRVTSPGLLFDSGTISTKGSATGLVKLPALRAGRQTIKIVATSGTGSTARTDTLVRTFTVVPTRLTLRRTAYVELPSDAGMSGAGGSGHTTLLISDASAGRYLPLLTDIAAGGGARLDRGLAADIAASILTDSMGVKDPTLVGDDGFPADRYQTSGGGLALMPYSSSDLELSVLVALIAPDRVDRSRLAMYLQTIRSTPDETRERMTFALAGLAGVGDPVLPQIQAAALDPALTDRERLMLGLGAAALGDANTARSIAGGLIAAHGERLGDQSRLRIGSSAADISEATSLMAVLLASIGDPRGPSFWAYTEANPAPDRLDVLPAVGYVERTLDRLPPAPVAFTYTLRGVPTRVDLDPRRSFELDLTASELASLTVTPITGTVGLTTTWRDPIDPVEIEPDPDVTISRTVSPTSVDGADLVTVTIQVRFGAQAAAGCHQVTDLVPSGITPVGSLEAWPEGDDGEAAPTDGYVMPYDQSGSRVSFCAEPSLQHRTVSLRYFARVVTPGTYAWEPAIAASSTQEGQAALTPASRIVVH